MDGPLDPVVQRAEELASSEPLLQFAAATWREPAIAVRFEEDPTGTLKEFGVKVPRGLSVVPLGQPGPDFVPFEIRFSRCRTFVVRDDETGRLSTETVCFGFKIVPTTIKRGPVA
jgi:hypothetical protein